MSTCDVCTETYTTELRKKVDCGLCDFKACSQCHQKYLLGTAEDAHCMNCRGGWTRTVLVNNFTNVFVNKKYKEHRENVLLERERSLMPETQPYVENELKCRKLEREKETLMAMRTTLYNQHTHAINADLNTMGILDDNWLEARIERFRRAQEIMKKISIINIDVSTIENSIASYRNPNFTPKAREVRFVRACPVNDCKGFLSTAWKCGLCEAHVCAQCHEVKDSDDLQGHVCEPNAVATADLLRKDSKPCPKCASMIFKINGCDQMYCTQCHTAFSWRSGQVVTGGIHNPHYYEYLRRTQGNVPRAPGDVVCGGLPDLNTFYRTTRLGLTHSDQKYLSDIHRNIGHVQYLANNRYHAANYLDNRDLRIKFMLNEMTEDDFKRKIQQREKAENRKRSIREVLVTYATVATDIFQKYASGEFTEAKDFHVEMGNLRVYTRDLLEDIQKTWKCVVPSFGLLASREHMLGEYTF